MQTDHPRLRPRTDRRNTEDRERVLRRVRKEFGDMPSVQLTLAQAQRLFGLRSDVCERVLNGLVSEGTLGIDSQGRYVATREPELRGGVRAVFHC